jgi:predicted Zn-dependent peptidase
MAKKRKPKAKSFKSIKSAASKAAGSKGTTKSAEKKAEAAAAAVGPSGHSGLSPDFRKVILPNGIRVLTESHPVSRAVSCGIWINKGTRDEAHDEAGLAHFIEHMLFKRTKTRSAYQVSRTMDAVGGDLNAFTSREYTCFVTQSLKENVDLSLELLSDLVCNPSFDSSDIKKEKQVVIQEIHMSEDNLEDFIFDTYFDMVYDGSPLGTPILGGVKSIEGMRREKVTGFHKRQYTSPNIVVSVAGNIDHEEVLNLVLKYLKPPRLSTSVNRKDVIGGIRERPKPKSFREVIRKPSEQAHMLIGFPAPDFTSPQRFDGVVVNTLLGGGMTSRLYQTVREEKGLVYSIYSQLITFTDAGLNLIYAGTEAKKMPQVIELTLKEIKKLQKHGVKRSDLDLFKTQVKGQILLSADDIDNRMNSLAINEMVFGQYRSMEDVIADVERVNLDSVHEYIETSFNFDDMSILLMGPLPEAPTKKWLNSL